jgi:uncharacterized phage protein (TIGR02218 family)
MKTIPPLLQADLQQSTTYIAFLWSITLADGRVIRGTEHDLDIVMPADSGTPPAWPAAAAGTYSAIANVTAGDIASNSDMAVDNLEVSGAVQSAPYTEILDVTVDEIEAGLLDMAPVAVYICNWQQPAHGCLEIKSGFLGAITRDSDGKYTTEVRGLSQLLSQIVVQTFSATCNVVKFGDARCKYNVAAITIGGTVAADSADLQQFAVTLAQATPPPWYSYVGGTLTFTTGANAGFSREVKLDPNKNAGVIQFWDQFPEAVAEGDAFTLSPGCDRQPPTCIRYGNYANWRGYGVFIPGVNALLAGPTSVAAL